MDFFFGGIALGASLVGIPWSVIGCIKARKRRRAQRPQQTISSAPLTFRRLDPQLVESAVAGYRYSPQRDRCMICLQTQCNAVTACGHYFHFICIRSWVERNQICPACRNPDLSSVLIIECLNCKAATNTINPLEPGADIRVAEIMRRVCPRCPGDARFSRQIMIVNR